MSKTDGHELVASKKQGGTSSPSKIVKFQIAIYSSFITHA
jgi:hypothetical protein